MHIFEYPITLGIIGDQCTVDVDCDAVIDNSNCTDSMCYCDSGYYSTNSNKTCTKSKCWQQTESEIFSLFRYFVLLWMIELRNPYGTEPLNVSSYIFTWISRNDWWRLWTTDGLFSRHSKQRVFQPNPQLSVSVSLHNQCGWVSRTKRKVMSIYFHMWTKVQLTEM